MKALGNSEQETRISSPPHSFPAFDFFFFFFFNRVMQRKFQAQARTEVGHNRILPAVSLNNANPLTTWQHFKQLSSVIS